jgi:hypothetical protein
LKVFQTVSFIILLQIKFLWCSRSDFGLYEFFMISVKIKNMCGKMWTNLFLKKSSAFLWIYFLTSSTSKNIHCFVKTLFIT